MGCNRNRRFARKRGCADTSIGRALPTILTFAFDDEAPANETAAVCEQTHAQLVAMAEDVLAKGTANGLDDCVKLAALGKYLSNVMDNNPENMGERILQTLLTGVIGLAETVQRGPDTQNPPLEYVGQN